MTTTLIDFNDMIPGKWYRRNGTPHEPVMYCIHADGRARMVNERGEPCWWERLYTERVFEVPDPRIPTFVDVSDLVVGNLYYIENNYAGPHQYMGVCQFTKQLVFSNRAGTGRWDPARLKDRLTDTPKKGFGG